MTNSIRNNIKSCTYSTIPPSSLITEHDQLSIDRIHHEQKLFDQTTSYNINNLQAISCYLSSVKHYVRNNADKGLFEKISAFAQSNCEASDLIIYAAQLFETEDDLLEGLLSVFPPGYQLSISYRQCIKIIHVQSLTGTSLRIYSTSPLAEADIARARKRHHDTQQQKQRSSSSSQASHLTSLSPSSLERQITSSKNKNINGSPIPKALPSLPTPESMGNSTPVNSTVTTSPNATTITYYSYNSPMINQQGLLQGQSDSSAAKNITMNEGTVSRREYSSALPSRMVLPKPSNLKTKEHTQHTNISSLGSYSTPQTPITSLNHYKKQQAQQPENTQPLTAVATPTTPSVTSHESVVAPIRKGVSNEIVPSKAMATHQQRQHGDFYSPMSLDTHSATNLLVDSTHGLVRPVSSSSATQQRKEKHAKLTIGPPPPRKISQQQHGSSLSNSKRSLYTNSHIYNTQPHLSRYTPYPVNASSGVSAHSNSHSYRKSSIDTTNNIPIHGKVPLPQPQRGRQAELSSAFVDPLPQHQYGRHSPQELRMEFHLPPPARQQCYSQQLSSQRLIPRQQPYQPSVQHVNSEYRLPEPPQQSSPQMPRSLLREHDSVPLQRPFQTPIEQQHRLPGPRPSLMQQRREQLREQRQLSLSLRQTPLNQTSPRPECSISFTILSSQNLQKKQQQQQQQPPTASPPKQLVEPLPTSSSVVQEQEQSNNEKSIIDGKEVPISSQQKEQKKKRLYIRTKKVKLFNQIHEFLQPDVYQYFLKLLDLYSYGIIDKTKLIVSLMPLFEDKTELLERLQKLVGYGADPREERPLKVIRPIIPKPNLLRCKKVDGSPSYREVTDLRWVNQPCSARDDLCHEVLNDAYVSYPTEQSEGGDAETFKLNKYEEQLHRSEEKRYELDCMIDDNEKAIMQLQLLQDGEELDSMDDAQKKEFNKTVNVDTFIYTKAIKQAYGKRFASKALQGFRKHPAQNIPVIIEFLEKEGEKWKQFRNELLPVWRETEAESYYLSLEYHSKRNNKAKSKK
ncbi:hypothetical protein INT45_006170 [Circinella minor]|uniref:Histone deacetylase interacting domain-containing protein n=1 Tax=Circinella minor TaxID=1195481 RepID=A0A8H7RZI0_9FUNG|nr:hypothetical protein INT45_006170 [Circinella minor]